MGALPQRRMWRTLLEYKIGDEQLAKDISAHFLELLPTKAKLFPHAKEILDYLTAKHYAIHLITNGFEKTQWSKLTHSGIDNYFTHVITSEGSNSLKPKREIFDFALNISGATIQNSIMIGDNLDADIQGAINVGMDCVFVNHTGAPVPDHPTYTIHHLKELEAIL
jgi:putative hydrolase of the HAD superfamily